MTKLYIRILKKHLPFILAAILNLVIGVLLRFSGSPGTSHTLGKLFLFIGFMILLITGNPIGRFKKQLEALGYTLELLVTDLKKGVSYKNMDLGTQFLVIYGIFPEIIFFGDVLWMYPDSDNRLHFVLKDGRETTVKAEDPLIGKCIAKQMEEAYPWILFGYHEEVAKLRGNNFEDLKELYTRKMFECVVEERLPKHAPYPSNRPKPQEAKPESEPQIPPYPRLPKIALEDVKIPNNSLGKYFKELVELCQAYPEDIHAEFHAPATAKEIHGFEKRNKLSLPAELKDLLLISNGFSMGYDAFHSLEEIEYQLKNWGPLEENEEEYIYIASVVGDGEEIVFSRKTGLIYWHDHGDFTEYGTLDAVLEERIEYQKENLGVE